LFQYLSLDSDSLKWEAVLTIKNGELVPAGQIRICAKSIDRLFDFVKNAVDIQDLAIVYNTSPDEAQAHDFKTALLNMGIFETQAAKLTESDSSIKHDYQDSYITATNDS